MTALVTHSNISVIYAFIINILVQGFDTFFYILCAVGLKILQTELNYVSLQVNSVNSNVNSSQK